MLVVRQFALIQHDNASFRWHHAICHAAVLRTLTRSNPDFKRRGGAKDFFGFEIHDVGIFLGKKILATIFSGSL